MQNAAKVLGLTDRAVRYLIINKKLKALKVGRDWVIDEKDLEKYRLQRVLKPDP